MEKVSLGIDQGSSSTKALILDEDATVLWQCSLPIGLTRDEGAHVEQDAEEILLSVQRAFDALLGYCTKHALLPQSLGLACQRSGVLAFEPGSGRALSPLLTWRDRSAYQVIEGLSAQARSRLQEISSLPVIPDYAGAKISLLQKSFPQALVGTLDSFLVYRLSQGQRFITDDSMAARSLLYDLRQGDWSAEACAALQVDRNRLAEVVASFATQEQPHLRFQDVPLTALMGDAQASFYASRVQGASALLNLGTLASLCLGVPAGQAFPVGCVTSVWASAAPQATSVGGSAARDRCFLSELIQFSCGALLLEAQKLLAIEKSATSLQLLSELAEAPAEPLAPVVFYAPRGEATPSWRLELPTIASTRAPLTRELCARVYLENIAFALAFAVQHVREQGINLRQVLALGGASACKPILRWLALCAELEISMSEQTQGSALGVALASRQGIAPLVELGSSPAATGVALSAVQAAASTSDSLVMQRYALWQQLRLQALMGQGTFHRVERLMLLQAK